MQGLIERVQEQLDNNHYVEAEDIQALLDYIQRLRWGVDESLSIMSDYRAMAMEAEKHGVFIDAREKKDMYPKYIFSPKSHPQSDSE